MPPFQLSMTLPFFWTTPDGPPYSSMENTEKETHKPYLSLAVPSLNTSPYGSSIDEDNPGDTLPASSPLSLPSAVSYTSVRLPRFELDYLDEKMRAVALASTSYYPMQMRNSVLRSPPVQIMFLNRKQERSNYLGILSFLPSELLQQIFLDMDLKSLFICRRVSFSMRSLIDGLYQFQQVLEYAPETVASLFETGVASGYTTRLLYYLLCRPGCKICGNFGPLLFIPGRHRCCMGCLRTNIGLMPMTLVEAWKAFGLTKKDLRSANIPIIRTLKGNYGLPGEFGPRPGRYIPSQETTEVISRLLARKMLGSVLTPSQRKRKELYEKTALQTFQEDSHINHSPLDALASLEGLTIDHIYRFQSSTFFPYLDPATSRVEDVHACRACQTCRSEDGFTDLWAWIQENSAMFNEDGLLEHLRHCRHM